MTSPQAALGVLTRAVLRPGHIFNLGDGFLPSTDPDVLGRLRELVDVETAGCPVEKTHPSGSPA